jgi:hypothetical protein
VRARATAKRFVFLEKENRLATVSQLGGGMKLEKLWYKEEVSYPMRVALTSYPSRFQEETLFF